MDKFFEIPGLSHIGREILRSLDFKTQASCRLVCKSWKNHVDDLLSSKTSVKDLNQMLRKFTKARSMSEHDKQEWYKFLKWIFNDKQTKSIPFIKSYLKHVFSRESQINYVNDKTPLLEFVSYGNIKMVKVIISKTGNIYDAILKCSSQIDTRTPDPLKVCVRTIHEMVRKFVKFLDMKVHFEYIVQISFFIRQWKIHHILKIVLKFANSLDL